MPSFDSNHLRSSVETFSIELFSCGLRLHSSAPSFAIVFRQTVWTPDTGALMVENAEENITESEIQIENTSHEKRQIEFSHGLETVSS